MPTISKDDKTITWVCQTDDEGVVRSGLQELLDANPGYSPVLVVESESGEPTTITNLSQSGSRGRSSAAVTTVLEPETVTVPDVEVTEPDDADGDAGDEDDE